MQGVFDYATPLHSTISPQNQSHMPDFFTLVRGLRHELAWMDHLSARQTSREAHCLTCRCFLAYPEEMHLELNVLPFSRKRPCGFGCAIRFFCEEGLLARELNMSCGPVLFEAGTKKSCTGRCPRPSTMVPMRSHRTRGFSNVRVWECLVASNLQEVVVQ